jgi:hypothetical protein
VDRGPKNNLDFAATMKHAISLKNLNLFRFQWPKQLGLEIYDYLLIGELTNGKQIRGRGTSTSEPRALQKSRSELIERAYVTERGLSSSGFAVHNCPNKAELNATFEIIERDLYLCYHLTQTPFLSINEYAVYQPLWLDSLRCNFLEPNGFELKIGIMANNRRFSAIFAAIYGAQKFGVVTGVACAETLDVSIEKAVLEAVRNAVYEYSTTEPDRSISIKKFHSLKTPSIDCHYRLGLHRDGRAIIDKLFCGQNKDSNRFDDYYLDTVESVIDKPLENSEFWIASSRNPFLQAYYSGHCMPSKVNLNRLRNFVGNCDLFFDDLNTDPHILD